jgi:hypothetical protein
VLAALISVASGVFLFVAVRGPVSEFGIIRVAFDPGLTIRVGAENAGLLRWGYLADMFGFYLLLIPLVVVLRDGLAPRTDPSLARFAAASGLAYVVIGAAGAAILAAVSPELIEAFLTGSAARREAANVTFMAFSEGVQRGMWQSAEALPLVAWLFVSGLLLRRAGATTLGAVGMALGALGFLGTLGSLLEVPALFAAGALVGVMPLWVLWLGVRFLRDPSFLAG